QNRFARFVYRLNLLLEPLRGTHCAKLADCIYYHWYSRICCCNPTNVANKAGVADVRTVGADADNVIRRGDIGACAGAQGSVVAAVTVRERVISIRRVAGSVDVVKERKGANSVVVRAAVVIDERVGSNGSVECASGVEQQRCSANCGIGIRGVEDQRPSTNTGVEVVRRSGKERIPTNSCVSS